VLTRLVLVEGFPGNGKSATAQWLARQIGRSGRTARWVYEEEKPHPVLAEGWTGQPSWQARLADWLTRWVAFAEQARGSDAVTVLESAWLQMPVARMLRQGLGPELIAAFVHKTVETMRGLEPVLIYLWQPAPEEAMQKLFVRRGMTWASWHVSFFDPSPFARARRLSGFDGLLRYWREHSDLCDAVVRGAGLPTLALDPRVGNWEERRRAIAGFLDIAPVAEAPWTDAQLDRFPGEYREGTRRLIVRRGDGGLVLDGLLWPGNRLLPVGPDVVEAESWPFVFTFLEEDGMVAGVRIDGPMVGQRRVAGTYEKSRPAA
jgi:hypothetical protein